MTNREWLMNTEDIDELVDYLSHKCSMCMFKLGNDNCIQCGCKYGIGFWLKAEHSALKEDIEKIANGKPITSSELAMALEKMGYKK